MLSETGEMYNLRDDPDEMDNLFDIETVQSALDEIEIIIEEEKKQ